MGTIDYSNITEAKEIQCMPGYQIQEKKDENEGGKIRKNQS